jgi:sterol O-acyltransferase
MKIHSYCSHNGMLSDIYFRMQAEEKQLQLYLSSLPDQGASIIAQAAAGKQVKDDTLEFERRRPRNDGDAVDVPIGTPMVPSGATAVASGYISHADSLRLRLSQNGRKPVLTREASAATTVSSRDMTPSASQQGSDDTPGKDEDPHPPMGTSLEPLQSRHHRPIHDILSYSDNEHVATLANNIDLMKGELRSNGVKGIMWPDNVTYFQFMEFMLFPTLVYQLEYPRTKT